MITGENNIPPAPCVLDGEGLFCYDLPTNPDRSIGKILVTGAFGYIGGRLVPELLARGYDVRVMTRGILPDGKVSWPGAEVVVGDALRKESLSGALDGIDTAFYLIHSMLLGPREFARADVKAAENFRKAAAESGIRRIIYLGGLGDVRSNLSDHLRSRMEVARELQSGPVPVTILRAAIIIGSGSASYEIIKNLVIKLPVIFVPGWAENLCQPISVRDVIKYLVGVMELEETSGMTFDIGGDDVMSYRAMMETVADLLHRKRLFIKVPSVNIGIFAYFASLMTPVPAPITRSLMEGLKNDVVCQDTRIRDYLPFETVSYRESLVRAMTREERDRVYTRWSDAYPPAHELAIKLAQIAELPLYRNTYSLVTSNSASSLFSSICRVGGKEGWFQSNWMWRLRGQFDRLILGVGSRRGRRRSATLEVNDVIDFWRVEDIRRDRRLLLRAEMKLPGKAWLEFVIDDLGDTRRLTVTAHYQTFSLPGRIYWYAFLPFHRILFKGLIKHIDVRSGPGA